MPTEILVVDDDKCDTPVAVFSAGRRRLRLSRRTQPARSRRPFARTEIQLALVDIYLGDANGVEFLQHIKAIQPDCDCVMMTAHASVETMAQSVKDGAVEYLGKPLRIDDLLGLVRRLESRRQSRSSGSAVAEEADPEGFAGTAIVGRSPRMLEVYRSIARVAPTDATVLIVGPSGSGKERVARAIHAHSQRARKLMTAINCGALAESVLESELFGHEKGAFTGADSVRRGLFENSNGGTIFLDEISETTPGFQVKLLRVLQETADTEAGFEYLHAGGCADSGRHQRGYRRAHPRQTVSRRSVLPPQRGDHSHALPGRAPGRYSAAGPPLLDALQRTQLAPSRRQ